MLLPSTDAMAVGAHDVALRDFVEERCTALEHRVALRQCERLLGWVSVIEVHLHGVEAASAVRTRNPLELAEKRDVGVLATPHAIDFLLAIRRVVGDVERSLVALRHGA